MHRYYTLILAEFTDRQTKKHTWNCSENWKIQRKIEFFFCFCYKRFVWSIRQPSSGIYFLGGKKRNYFFFFTLVFLFLFLSLYYTLYGGYNQRIGSSTDVGRCPKSRPQRLLIPFAHTHTLKTLTSKTFRTRRQLLVGTVFIDRYQAVYLK